MITIDPPSRTSPDASVEGVPAISKSSLTRFLKRAQAAVGLTGEVSVLLTDDERMRGLNRGFRGKRMTTDVLSFPAPVIPGLPAEHQHAGDLAISVVVAGQQAAAFGHTLETELRVLILHGLLHLAGLDHEADAGEMRDREQELRAKLKLPSGLIERASAAKPAAVAVGPARKIAAKTRVRA